MVLGAISSPNTGKHFNISAIPVVGVFRASGTSGGIKDPTTMPSKRVAQFAQRISLTRLLKFCRHRANV